LPPAATEVGAAEFVVTRSACVAVATTSAAVALLFPEFGSVVDELTVAVSLIAVPAAVPALTLTTTVKLPLPGATDGFVHVIVPVPPTAGVTQLHPAAAVMDWNVVFGGVTSVKLALVAVLGPAFVTTCVYVILLPACTGTGLAEFVTDKSADPATVTMADALLFAFVGSLVVLATETVSVMVVPGAVFTFTVTTKVKVAVAPDATGPGFVQVSVPRLHVHPAGPVSDCAVVFAGVVSVSVRLLAAAGPPLVTTCV
jgi:hypothetical protein